MPQHTSRLRVGLVDPFTLSRESLAFVLREDYQDIQVVFLACNASDAMARLAPGLVDVLVISDYLGDTEPDGFTLAATIRDRLSYPPIVIATASTGHMTDPELGPARAAEAGAWGYLDAGRVPPEGLATAIRQAAAGSPSR
jgi:DNA-binding NarL/FixJ family response regulator